MLNRSATSPFRWSIAVPHQSNHLSHCIYLQWALWIESQPEPWPPICMVMALFQDMHLKLGLQLALYWVPSLATWLWVFPPIFRHILGISFLLLFFATEGFMDRKHSSFKGNKDHSIFRPKLDLFLHPLHCFACPSSVCIFQQKYGNPVVSAQVRLLSVSPLFIPCGFNVSCPSSQYFLHIWFFLFTFWSDKYIPLVIWKIQMKYDWVLRIYLHTKYK